MPVTEPIITYVVFQEGEIRGDWDSKISDALDHGVDPEEINNIGLEKDSSEYYDASNDNCELWIVRPDGLRKGWLFKKNSRIVIRESTVKFYQFSIVDELFIDEEKQKGG